MSHMWQLTDKRVTFGDFDLGHMTTSRQNPKYADVAKWLADTVRICQSVRNLHGCSGQRDHPPETPRVTGVPWNPRP